MVYVIHLLVNYVEDIYSKEVCQNHSEGMK